MLGKVFKAYDIRGTYPDLLDEKMAWQIGYGVSKFLVADAAAAGESSPMMRNIVVGRDMRKSSPSLAKALIQGICDQGGNVIDVGLVDTSFIYFAVNHLDCAGGVMTTASHNPPQYNGFKISKRKAKPVGEASGLAEVRKHAAMIDKATMTSAGGKVEQRNLWEDYARHVRGFLDLSDDWEKRAGAARLKVVIDASNGMAGTMIPMVFGKKCPLGPAPGIDIIEVNFENNKGEFVHEPNPLVAANLRQIQERVVKEHADVGFCYDGDADRCVVIDETGAVVGCDHLTAVLAPFFIKKAGKGAGVVYDLRSTKAVHEDILKAGGTPIRSRVGHVFMKGVMAEKNCIFGGELSGHFYFRDNFNADSGAIAMCTVLTLLRNTGRKMSSLVAPAKRYVQSGEINFTIEDKDGALANLRKQVLGWVPSAHFDELDGVTIDCFDKAASSGGGWWCNVRKSNTEPLLRLNLEAKDRKVLDTMLARISPLLGVKVDH